MGIAQVAIEGQADIRQDDGVQAKGTDVAFYPLDIAGGQGAGQQQVDLIGAPSALSSLPITAAMASMAVV